jgi:hypothetical protein
MILFFEKTIRHYVHIINPRKFNWRYLTIVHVYVHVPVRVRVHGDGHGQGHGRGRGHGQIQRRFVEETFC